MSHLNVGGWWNDVLRIECDRGEPAAPTSSPPQRSPTLGQAPACKKHKSWQRSAPTFWTQREQGPDQACFHRKSTWQGQSLKRKYLTRSRRLRELITVAMAQSPPILALSFLMSLFFDSRMTKKVCIIGRVGHPQKPVFAHNILAIFLFEVPLYSSDILWCPFYTFPLITCTSPCRTPSSAQPHNHHPSSGPVQCTHKGCELEYFAN